MLVQQILNSKADKSILWVAPGSKVREAIGILSEKRVGTVVVSSDGLAAEGILSERDIVRQIGRDGAGCLDTLVSDMMTANPITCTTDETADQVLEKMTEGRFRHLPVMEGGKMVGLISIGDVVKARLAELDMERTALEDMVMGR